MPGIGPVGGKIKPKGAALVSVEEGKVMVVVEVDVFVVEKVSLG